MGFLWTMIPNKLVKIDLGMDKLRRRNTLIGRVHRPKINSMEYMPK